MSAETLSTKAAVDVSPPPHALRCVQVFSDMADGAGEPGSAAAGLRSTGFAQITPPSATGVPPIAELAKVRGKVDLLTGGFGTSVSHVGLVREALRTCTPRAALLMGRSPHVAQRTAQTLANDLNFAGVWVHTLGGTSVVTAFHDSDSADKWWPPPWGPDDASRTVASVFGASFWDVLTPHARV